MTHRGPFQPLLLKKKKKKKIAFEPEILLVFSFCLSQSVGGWKGPLGIPQLNPLPKQGHPQQAAQDLVQAGLEYLQRRRLPSPSGQPGPGLRHPQREEVLPRVQLDLPRLQFVPIAPCPVLNIYDLAINKCHCILICFSCVLYNGKPEFCIQFSFASCGQDENSCMAGMK